MKAKLKTIFITLFITSALFAKDIYISPVGNDANDGSLLKPFASFEQALKETVKYAGKQVVNVWFMEGTYYLNKTLVLDSKYSGTAKKPLNFSALPGARVVIKGSQKLDQLKWKKYDARIFVSTLPEKTNFDQLFVNGERQIRARFPNYDEQNPLRGGNGYQLVTGGTNRRYDEWFTFNHEQFTTKEWKNPQTGIVHAYQSHNWGNMQYRIKDIDRTKNKILLGEGGWQLQRAYGIGGKGNKASWFYIENIFEELDNPGEWFLDSQNNLLYFYPKPGVNLANSTFEVPVVKDLIQIKGTSSNPVKNIRFKGLKFTQSTLTFMQAYEPLARGDWAIHRGGAIYMEGAENCIVEDCEFTYLGGNGIFMSAYNRNNTVRRCRFVHTGESAVCFVGSPAAVRFYQTWDDKEIEGKNWNEMRKGMDMQAGPKTPDYPKNCVVENCVMHDFGDYGKQVAGIYISMSHKIRSSHNTIYNCPRAGICINDGTWGGHIIEYCDIWETVRETGEHGPFNSWGRERQWLGGSGSNKDFRKELTLLDAIDVTIIRNNRIANFRKSVSAGNWTIDLDDGSSNYEIYNNLNLGSTIKLRDGIMRKVFNNISVSAVPLGWHVWPEESQDEVFNNIFVISGSIPGKEEPTKQFIRPIGLPAHTKWSNHYNNNLYWNVNFPDSPEMIKGKTLEQWQSEGYDLNAKIANPLFIDPLNGDFSVKEDSKAISLGFKNFTMDKFGHQMTRIIPFGGDFEDEMEIKLIADARSKKEYTLHFTVDGSEPTIHSPLYSGTIKLTQSTHIKAQTFDSNGNPVGFTNEARFNKVNKVEYPSWYSTLLAGKYTGSQKKEATKAIKMMVNGALMVNIADDPDLIDASGGYNTGCFIRSIDPLKGKAWLDAGLSETWIIQQVNNNDVHNTSELQDILQENVGKTIHIKAVRNYGQNIFKIKL